MAITAEFIDRVTERFSRMGTVTSRRVFGGACFYLDGSIFALADDGALYLKGSPGTENVYRKAGLAPFVFLDKDRGPVEMRYFAAPDDVWTDDASLERWTGLALEASAEQAPKKRKK